MHSSPDNIFRVVFLVGGGGGVGFFCVCLGFFFVLCLVLFGVFF